MTFDFELARRNMITNQVRPWDVLDPGVLGVLGHVRREDFVPAAWRNLAFADLTLPLGKGEVMMKPVVEGRLLQALRLGAADTVLEVGTGSGYLTACLASLASHVTSVDIHPEFTQVARENLAHAKLSNVSLDTADAWQAYHPDTGFDALVVTGAVDAIPERFLQWLKPGGRAFFIVGQPPIRKAVLVHREDTRAWRQESLFETDIPYLVHAAPAAAFSF